MLKNANYHYYVEGECEAKLINTYKKPPYSYFAAGKVEVLNVVQKEISTLRLASLKVNTIVILVYDTDVENDDMLKKNVNKLTKFGFKTYHIQSVKNFEDEIVNSTNLKSVLELFNSKNVSEFKSHFISQSNVHINLFAHEFDIDRIWTRRVDNDSVFSKYYSESGLKVIRKKK